MAISFTLLTFNNWLQKLEQKQKNFQIEEIKSNKDITIKPIEQKNISKIITLLQLIDKAGVQLLQGMIKHLEEETHLDHILEEIQNLEYSHLEEKVLAN